LADTSGELSSRVFYFEGNSLAPQEFEILVKNTRIRWLRDVAVVELKGSKERR